MFKLMCVAGIAFACILRCCLGHQSEKNSGVILGPQASSTTTSAPVSSSVCPAHDGLRNCGLTIFSDLDLVKENHRKRYCTCTDGLDDCPLDQDNASNVRMFYRGAKEQAVYVYVFCEAFQRKVCSENEKPAVATFQGDDNPPQWEIGCLCNKSSNNGRLAMMGDWAKATVLSDKRLKHHLVCQEFQNVCQPQNGARLCGSKYFADPQSDNVTSRETYCTCTHAMDDCPLHQENVDNGIVVTSLRGGLGYQVFVFCEPVKHIDCSKNQTPAVVTYKENKPVRFEIQCLCMLNENGHLAMRLDEWPGFEGPLKGNGTHHLICRESMSVCQPNDRLRLCARKYYAVPHPAKETWRETYCTCNEGEDNCHNWPAHYVTVIDDRNPSDDLETQPQHVLVFCEPLKMCGKNETPAVAMHKSKQDKPLRWKIRCLCLRHLVMELDNSRLQFSCMESKTCRTRNDLRICGTKVYQHRTETSSERYCACNEGKDDCSWDLANAYNVTVGFEVLELHFETVYFFCEPIQRNVCKKNQKAGVRTTWNKKAPRWNIECFCNANEHLVIASESEKGDTHNFICQRDCQSHDGLRLCGYKYFRDQDSANEISREIYCTCTRGKNDCPLDDNNTDHELTIKNLNDDLARKPIQVLVFCERLKVKRRKCSSPHARTATYEGNKPIPWEIHCLCKLNTHGRLVMRLDEWPEFEGPLRGNGTHHLSCLESLSMCQKQRLCGSKYFAVPHSFKETRRETYCTCTKGEDDCPLYSYHYEVAHVIDDRNRSDDLETQPIQTLFFCGYLPTLLCSKNQKPATYDASADKPLQNRWQINCRCKGFIVMRLGHSPHNGIETRDFFCDDIMICPSHNGVRWCGYQNVGSPKKHRSCTCTEGKDDCPFGRENHNVSVVYDTEYSIDFEQESMRFEVFCERIQRDVCKKNEIAAVETLWHRKQPQWKINCLCNKNEYLVRPPILYFESEELQERDIYNVSCQDSMKVCRPLNGLRVCGYKYYYTGRHAVNETDRRKYCTCNKGKDDCPMDQNSADNVIRIDNQLGRDDLENRAVHVLVFCEPLNLTEHVCSKDEKPALYEGDKPFPWQIHCLCNKSHNIGPLVMRFDDPLRLEGPLQGNSNHRFSCQSVCQPRYGVRLCGRKYYDVPHSTIESGRETYCTCTKGDDDCPLDQTHAPSVTVIDDRNPSDDLESQPIEILVFCERLQKKYCGKNQKPATFDIGADKLLQNQWQINCLCKGHMVMTLDDSIHNNGIEARDFICRETKICAAHNGVRWCGTQNLGHSTKHRYCTCTEGEDDCPFDQENHNVSVVYGDANNDVVPLMAHYFCEKIQLEVCRENETAVVATYWNRKLPRWKLNCLCNKTEHLVWSHTWESHKPKERVIYNMSCHRAKPKPKLPRMKLCRASSGPRLCGNQTFNPLTGTETRVTLCTCHRGKIDCPFNHDHYSVTMMNSNLQPRGNNIVYVFCETLKRKLCRRGKKSAIVHLRKNKVRAVDVHCLCTNNGPMEVEEAIQNPKRHEIKYVCRDNMPKCEDHENCYRYENFKKKKNVIIKCLCRANTVCREKFQRGRIHSARCLSNNSQHAMPSGP